MRPKRLAPLALVALVALVGPLAAGGARALTLERRGALLFAGGELGNDLGAFEQALAAPPAAQAVVFTNSPGGDLWTAIRIGRLIADRGLTTVLAGRCLSACAIMFAGGRERRVAAGVGPGEARLGIHGAHNRETRQVDPQLQPQIYAFFRQQLGERFDAAVMNRALYEMNDAQAMLIVPVAAAGTPRPVQHCPSARREPEHCHTLPGVSALGLGLLTEAAPYPLTPLPLRP